MKVCLRLQLDPETLPTSASAALSGLQHRVDSPFALSWKGSALRLSGPAGVLAIDWLQGRAGYRGARAAQERLVRACGARQDPQPRVVDATPGLGTDAWLLAAAGAEVTLVEQNPVILLLLADALERAGQQRPEIAARLQLRWGDSCRYLAEQADEDAPMLSAVYLDPMYPARAGSALGTARMRLLAELNSHAGFPHDRVADLFAAARAAPTRRVVLKRPLRVPLPAELPSPGHSLQGRSTRFDVWRLRA